MSGEGGLKKRESVLRLCYIAVNKSPGSTHEKKGEGEMWDQDMG